MVWRVVVEGREERVFSTAQEAVEFAWKMIERGARELTIEPIISWRKRLYWAVKRVLSKPLKVRVLEYKLRYRKRQPPLTLPL